MKQKIKQILRGIDTVRLAAEKRWSLRRIHRSGARAYILIATPTQGNLGDQAIVYAEQQMLGDMGLHDNLVECSREEFERLQPVLRKCIAPQDVLMIDGGGNIGTLWPVEESKMWRIIQMFPQNPIYILPQTAYFSPDAIGEETLAESVAIYTAHPKLTVFCRDEITYALFEKHFPTVRHFLTPDMVPYIKPDQPNVQRSGVLLCLRADKEAVNDGVRAEAKIWTQNAACSYRETNTVIRAIVTSKNRNQVLKEKWCEFASAQLVITDRLHGMAFSAITGTPCIAMDNISHKVRDGYRWLSYLPYLHFCENAAQLPALLEKCLADKTSYTYTRQPLENSYRSIMRELSGEESKE